MCENAAMRWLVVLLFACRTHHGNHPDARAPDAAPDRTRRVVISHPYDASGGNANSWDVLDLSPTGAVTMPGRPFEMGRASDGVVEFTIDGKIGMVPQSDGSLGVFSLADDG